jgi:aromatic-L-amino-acid/L-tryptophan decarboxylase
VPKDLRPADLPPLTLPESEMRAAMAEVGEMIVDHFVGLRDLPVTRPSTLKDLHQHLVEPLPEQPVPVSQLLAQIRGHVIAEMTHNDHPRNFAFVPGPSNFVGAMADALAAAFNIFCGAWIGPSGAAQIEILTVEWLRQLFEFPENAGGLFVSGGSMANLTGLAVARHAMLRNNPANAAIYFSDQTHSSVAKGLKILGFSQYQLRKLKSGDDFRLPMEALRKNVAADRLQGMVPFCVVANAGTTNSGAVDPMNEIADFCAAEGLWMHVDGAYGASAALCEKGRAALDGMNRADSLSIDPHKWLFQPYEIGCALIRKQEHLKETFKVSAEYLKIMEESAEQPNFSDYGVQLTRGFRALKLWMSFKAFGIPAFREAIAKGIENAIYAEEVIRQDSCWEIVTPATLGIVTFRYVDKGKSEAELNAINSKMASDMILSGYAMASPTGMRGKTVQRMCTINPRTTKEDIAETIHRLAELGRKNSK